MTHNLLISVISVLILAFQTNGLQLYNPGTTSYRNQTWMSILDYGIPIRQISMLGTHNSLGLLFCLSTGGFQYTQSNSLQVQLESGIRAIDIRVKHTNNKFQLYDRSCNLGVNFDQVLTTVQSFLASYPSETVLLHLVEEQSSSGCSRTFEDTFKAYRDSYPGLFWLVTTQDPQLGEVRGKILLLQEFNSLEVHGLLWATFSILPNKKMGTNWDLYSKWLDIKAFLPKANAAKKSQIQFWTGHGGSYPYFVVSGKSSMSGSRLLTGLTTPGFKNSYPDFPRISCFIGICSIVFEGMNIMGYNYIVNNGYKFTGIVYTDLYGDDLLKKMIDLNKATFAKCSSIKVSEGCTLCALGSGTCLKCNTNLNYVYDSANQICLAKVGYYLDGSYFPQLCSSAMPGCLQCTSATICTKCDVIMHYKLYLGNCIAEPGYYLNTTFIPVPCPQTGCAECIDDITCSVCSAPTNYIKDLTTNYTCKCDDVNFFEPAPSVEACICMTTYYLSPASTCLQMPKCPDTSGGCLDCGVPPTDTVCLLCDSANNFIFDPTHTYCVCDNKYFFDGTTCASCTVNDAACDQCANANLCLSCVDNFTLAAGVCQCLPQHYMVDNDTCNLCSVGCLTCTGIAACTVCDSPAHFTLVGGYCECVAGRFEQNGTCYLCGDMAGCLDCNNAGCTKCQPLFGFHLNVDVCECDYGFFINAMKVCEKCMMQGCLHCTTQDICVDCDTSLYYLGPDNKCNDICGDGIRIYVDCDDGNTVNGDGCSNDCKVQKDYTCTGGSITTKDSCSYSGPFNLTVLKTVKDKRSNKVFIDILIKPNIQSLSGIDFTAAINPTFPHTSKAAVFDMTKSKISFEFTYNSSLNSLSSEELGINFEPPNNEPEYYYMRSASAVLPGVTDNNLALKYYDQKIYSLLDLMNTLTQVTTFLYIGICLVCFVFVSKLIAIELLLVPQVTFAGLIMIEKIESLLQPLNNFRLTNGFNPLFTDNAQLPPRLSILMYGGSFLTNFNICIVIILIPVIVGLLLFVLGKVKKSKKLLKYSFRTLKEWTLSVLLVFQFQFTISFGIDVIFGQTMMGKVLGGSLFIGLLCLLVLLYKRPLNFGEFKSYFNKQPWYLNHYIIVVLFRIFLALDLIILSSNRLCGFLATGLAGLYVLFLIITRPYLKNLRPILNIIVMIGILAVESFYKINFNSAEAQFLTSYLPLFIVGVLLLLLLTNVIFMILEVRERFQKKKIDEYQKNQDQSFNQELRKQIQKQLQVLTTIQKALKPSNMNKIKEKQKSSEYSSTHSEKLNELKKMHKKLMGTANLECQAADLTEKDKILYNEI